MEEGTLFCKQCGAPQIRVAIQPTPTLEALPEPVAPSDPRSFSEPPVISELHWPQARVAAFLGGLLEAVLMFTELWFIGILVGAFFSVFFYKRRAGGTVNPSLGAQLGLISGAIGFALFAVLGSLALWASKSGGGLRQEVMRQLEQAAAQYPAQAQQALDYLKSAQGWGLFVALLTIFMLILFLVFSTIGGAAGGALLGKKNRH